MNKLENYISETYLTKLLQRNIHEFVKIKSISEVVNEKQKPATCNDSGHSASNKQQQLLVTKRPVVVAITYEISDGITNKCTLIFKSTLETKNMPTFIKILKRLSNEQHIHEFFISEFERIYKDMGVLMKFAPQYFKNIDAANSGVIIWKDPKDHNFAQINPIDGMNTKHVKATLKKLAEFHAISLVRRQRYGECGERDYVGLITPETREFLVQRSAAILKAFAEALPLYDRFTCYGKYLQLIPTAEQFVNELMRLSVYDENDFNVLNHGALWSKNIFFKYNEKKNNEIIETIFTNYEFCKYGTPAYDLYFLIYTSVNWEIKYCLYNFLKPYHEYLVHNLKLLKYKYEIPRLQQVKELMEETRFYAFFISIVYLPLLLMPSADDEMNPVYNFENIMTCDDETAEKLLKNMMTNRTYVQDMRQTLYHLYQIRAFDIQT